MLQSTQQRGPKGAEVVQYRRRMLLALAILLTALVVMLVKDSSFWFGSDESAVADESPITTGAPVQSNPSQAQVNVPSTPVSTASTKKHETAAHSSAPAAGASIVASDRAVLPPLEVEVVNDRTHQKVQAQANPVKVDMDEEATARELAPVNNAVQRTEIQAEKSSPALPSYPSLAGQMRVQGSVLLQAMIGVDGMIQQLRVISGPAILSSAAREAAMQWRFKPYLQNGKPVETQARITVNFVIKVWDDEARNHETTPTQTAQSTRPGE